MHPRLVRASISVAGIAVLTLLFAALNGHCQERAEFPPRPLSVTTAACRIEFVGDATQNIAQAWVATASARYFDAEWKEWKHMLSYRLVTGEGDYYQQKRRARRDCYQWLDDFDKLQEAEHLRLKKEKKGRVP